LLLEPQRTNLVTQSEYFESTDWTLQQGSITSNDVVSPEGVQNASKFTPNTANAAHIPYYNISLASGTASVYVKSAGQDYVGIKLVGGTVTTSNCVVFNLINGTIETNLTGNTASIESVGNDWYRISVTTSSAITALLIITMPDSSNFYYVGNGVDGIYIYGAQLEESSYPTSYIPTYGASVTRVADSCLDAGNSSTFNDSEGVVFVEAQGLVNGGENRYITLGDNTSSNRLQIVYTFTTNRLQVSGTSLVGGVFTAINYNSFDQTALNKVAVKYSETELTLVVNGVKIESNSSNASFANGTLDSFDFALWNKTSAPFQAKLNQVLYFPTALTDEELADLTTI